MSDIQALAAIVSAIATPGAKPKDIISAVREKHPEASKKDVVRAAFYALTAGAGDDPEKGSNLHDFAMSERGNDETATKATVKRSKSRKPKSG